MTYGIEVKNKNNRVIFGTKHLSIKKVASGYIAPSIYKSSTGTVFNSTSLVTLPAGVTENNALVFARPELTDEYKEANPDGLTHAPWALCLTFVNENAFTISGTDTSISYYDGSHGDKGFAFIQSYEQWTDQNSSGMLPARVYYEVWTQGLGSEEDDSHGLKVSDDNNDIIFDSNRPFFKAESTIKGRPNIHFDFAAGPKINHNQTSFLTLSMLQRSKVSQELYLVCLNGTAHTSAIFIGGPTSPVTPKSITSSGQIGGYETPRASKTAYYRNYVEFHYAIEDDLFMAQPHIRMVQRLQKTQNRSVSTSEAYYNIEPRYNEEVGVPACLLIGKSS